MSELKLELGSSYHTSSGTLVKIVARRLFTNYNDKGEPTGIYSSVYVGDNNNLYDSHGHSLEQLTSDDNVSFKPFEKPEDLSYPYGGKPLNSLDQDVLNKITELKILVEASGLSVEVIIK